ncbi:MAG: hypothetical protein MZV63_26890 [Marinilabiliales bacterium]|nr:hypothetical protein [Marinilabiliales bacterium]
MAADSTWRTAGSSSTTSTFSSGIASISLRAAPRSSGKASLIALRGVVGLTERKPRRRAARRWRGSAAARAARRRALKSSARPGTPARAIVTAAPSRAEHDAHRRRGRSPLRGQRVGRPASSICISTCCTAPAELRTRGQRRRRASHLEARCRGSACRSPSTAARARSSALRSTQSKLGGLRRRQPRPAAAPPAPRAAPARGSARAPAASAPRGIAALERAAQLLRHAGDHRQRVVDLVRHARRPARPRRASCPGASGAGRPARSAARARRGRPTCG